MNKSTITTDSTGPVQDRVERLTGASMNSRRGTVHHWHRRPGGLSSVWETDCNNHGELYGHIRQGENKGFKCARCFPPLNNELSESQLRFAQVMG